MGFSCDRRRKPVRGLAVAQRAVQNRASARALTTDVDRSEPSVPHSCSHWMFVKVLQINKCRPPRRQFQGETWAKETPLARHPTTRQGNQSKGVGLARQGNSVQAGRILIDPTCVGRFYLPAAVLNHFRPRRHVQQPPGANVVRFVARGARYETARTATPAQGACRHGR